MKSQEKKLIILLVSLISISLFSLRGIQKELNAEYIQTKPPLKIEKEMKPPRPIMEKKSKPKNGIEIKFHSAFFYPQDKKFRNYYDFGYLPSLDLAFPIYKDLYIWTDIGFFHKEKTTNEFSTRVKHSITQVPLNLGLMQGFSINHYLTLMLKFGANYLYSEEKASIPDLVLSSKKHHFGFIAGILGKFTFKCGFLMDVFLNYRYNKAEIDKDHYLGGIEAGVGIGYKF